jgi:hypothetical protein
MLPKSMQAVMWLTGGQVTAMDGKKPRGSQNHVIAKGAIAMECLDECQLCGVGQERVNDKSNEISTISELPRTLAIKRLCCRGRFVELSESFRGLSSCVFRVIFVLSSDSNTTCSSDGD